MCPCKHLVARLKPLMTTVVSERLRLKALS